MSKTYLHVSKTFEHVFIYIMENTIINILQNFSAFFSCSEMSEMKWMQAIFKPYKSNDQITIGIIRMERKVLQSLCILLLWLAIANSQKRNLNFTKLQANFIKSLTHNPASFIATTQTTSQNFTKFSHIITQRLVHPHTTKI